MSSLRCIHRKGRKTSSIRYIPKKVRIAPPQSNEKKRRLSGRLACLQYYTGELEGKLDLSEVDTVFQLGN